MKWTLDNEFTFDRPGMIEMLRSIANDLENGGSYTSGTVNFAVTDANGVDCTISIVAEVGDRP